MPNRRVLIVDDSARFLDAAEAFLASEPGVDVVGRAHTGREALDAVTRLRPDLVLMDIAMPEMDGLTAARLLKARCDDVRVVLVTLSDTPEYRRAAAVVADAFLPKDELVSGFTPLVDELFSSPRRTAE